MIPRINQRSYRRVVLDVGAFDGASTLPLALRDPSTLVIAFEPSADLARDLKRRSAHVPNFVVIEAAVDEVEGEAAFNLAPVGTGSLRTMVPPEERGGWLEGVNVSERQTVPTVRLDRALASLGLARVDYLHCDAQGNDLRVLRSLGNMLRAVDRGVIEVPARRRLYAEGHTRTDAVSFLLRSGFRIYKVAASDIGTNEQNVYYRAARWDNRITRRLNTDWTKVLIATSGLWVLPTRIRVKAALGRRTREIFQRHRQT